ncbi:hypothetical protein V8E51_016313 [Hyaloscypha variabilis]
MSSPPPPHHHIFQNRSHSCAASLRAAVEQTPPSRRPGCWLAGAWAAMFDLKLLSGQPGQPGQPAEQTSRIESTTGSAQGRRSQVGHFIEVWRWIWRYRLGCTHGAMHPLPMERDDSLWHPGLCWTSPAAGAHLHKFVTSFWRVDRQTAGAALLLLLLLLLLSPRIAAVQPGPCLYSKLLNCFAHCRPASDSDRPLLTGYGAARPSLEARRCTRCKY